MKLRRPVLFIALAGTVMIAFLSWNRSETPLDDFERHFGNGAPASVTDIAVSGLTTFAGSDEILTFRIDPKDLDHLLQQRGFKEVTRQVTEGIKTGIAMGDWQSNRAKAAGMGIAGNRFFEISELGGMIYYLVISDMKTGTVFYHYFKT